MAFLASSLHAQGMQVSFGDLKQDTSQPVEVSADQLKVDQTNGSAVFTGNVVVGQGDMRLAAGRVQVEYGDTNGSTANKISKLLATGGVILTNGGAAAESLEAVYTIDSGSIVMTGDVILTQGASVVSSDKMVVDLNTGTALMTGRVKSIFQTGGN